MKKNCMNILFLIGFVYSSLFAQIEIASFKNFLKENSTDIKDVIPVVNTKNNDLAILIADAKNVYAYKFNDEFKLTGQLSSETKKRKYKILLGSSIYGNEYKIFLTNKSNTQFASVSFSFNDKKNTIKEFLLPSGQTFIQTVSLKNKFYIISGNKMDGSIYLNYLNEDGNLQYIPLDIAELKLLNKKNKKVRVVDLLLPFNYSPIKKFEENTPNSIESVSETAKMYLKDDNLIISFDNNENTTQLFTVNLTNYKVSTVTFNKPLSNVKSGRKKTNSFIFDDKIAVVAATKNILSMYILDYSTGNFIKEYAVNQDEEILFKNTPIIQKGGFYNGYRELEKTKKFLRKITAGKIGVSVIKNKNTYLLTLGGYVEQRTAAPMMMGGFGGIGGAIASVGSVNVNLFFNPTMFAYNSFTNTKSTQIECLFDTNFEHIKDAEVPKNIFDKIKSTPKKSDIGYTIFKYKDFYIRSDYTPSDKTYHLRKFTR